MAAAHLVNLASGTALEQRALVRDRGFGCIKTENGSEIFFHATGVTGSTPYDNLTEGQAVTYDKGQDDRGRGERATNVQAA